jgi:hypothetical protein
MVLNYHDDAIITYNFDQDGTVIVYVDRPAGLIYDLLGSASYLLDGTLLSYQNMTEGEAAVYSRIVADHADAIRLCIELGGIEQWEQ